MINKENGKKRSIEDYRRLLTGIGDELTVPQLI